MCGIVGIINYDNRWQPKMREIFQQLLLLDVVRGKDSTGVFKAKDKTVDWRKSAVAPWDFLALKNVDEFLTGLGDYPFVVGHNRWATRGKVTDDNAHPFEEGKITLVHNGTLVSTYNLPGHTKMEVDSQMIADSINQLGIEETSKKMNGAYALAWYDTKRKNLNLLRNAERPLYLMDIPKENMYLFGSEIGLLRWVCIRSGYEPGEWGPLDTHMVYSFTKGEKKPTKKRVEPCVEPWKQHFQNHGGSHRGYLPPCETADDGCSIGGGGDAAPVVPEKGPTGFSVPVGVGPAQQQVRQVARVLHMHPHQASPELTQKFKVGDKLFFSIEDFEDQVKQGGFVPITGSWPDYTTNGKEHPDVIVRGNFSGNVEELFTTKKLMEGIITGCRGLRHGKVLVQVKEVKITQELDPFFFNEQEQKEWASAWKLKSDQHPCHDCGEFNPKSKLFLVYKTGGPRYMCIKCVHGFDPHGRVSQPVVSQLN